MQKHKGQPQCNQGSCKHRAPSVHRRRARSRIGDIEVDLMMGSNHKSELLVITDRTSLVTIIDKLSSKSADEVYEKMKQRITNFSASWIKTITFDNGKEFAHHHKIAKDLKVKT